LRLAVLDRAEMTQKIAIAITQLARLGGKEKDCLAVAEYLARAGHDVTLVTMAAGEHANPPVKLKLLPIAGAANHVRTRAFAAAARRYAQEHGALLFAFDRIPGADFFYLADMPSPRTWLAWPPRRAARISLERGAMADPAQTHLFFLTERQRADYAAFHRFDAARTTILPTILHAARIREALIASRARARADLGIAADARVALSLATNLKMKGVDRTLDALARAPDLHLIIAGADKTWLRRRIARLGLGERVKILAYVSDVMPLMAAADLLIHPARAEAAGQVISEALIADRPAIVSRLCGYAGLIEQSGAGLVLPEPFRAEDLGEALAQSRIRLPEWKAAAARQGATLRAQKDEWLAVIAETIGRRRATDIAAQGPG